MPKISALTSIIALCVGTGFGQVRVPMGHGVVGNNGPITAGSGIPIARHGVAPGFVGSSRRFHEGFRRVRPGFSAPFWFPGYYVGDYGYPYDYEVPPPEPAEAPQAASPAPAPVSQVKEEPLPAPVMLELHGSQWVKVSNFTAEAPQAANASAPVHAAAKEMPPAVLVFRDGHTEELTSYSIIGPVIYTKANYWTSGTWTRTIKIADLDLPATFQQNQQRGVKFELPSSPDEVMIRP